MANKQLYDKNHN
jgi:hypothetical protein